MFLNTAMPLRSLALLLPAAATRAATPSLLNALPFKDTCRPSTEVTAHWQAVYVCKVQQLNAASAD
jgi:hypothetical protein